MAIVLQIIENLIEVNSKIRLPGKRNSKDSFCPLAFAVITPDENKEANTERYITFMVACSDEVEVEVT